MDWTSIPGVLTANALAVVVLMVVGWLSSLIWKDASLVDRYWGFGFAVIAAVTALLRPEANLPAYVLAGATMMWGLRLTAYITWRNWGDDEDYRYAAMRKRRPDTFWLWSLFMVFGLQGVLMWFISLPVQIAVTTQGGSLGPLLVAGLLLWLIGFYFESVGDWQLARFKADPANKGKVMDQGLWRYTRHPNYFGDTCVWWGLFIMACGAPYGVFLVLSPLLMTGLIIKVSGVAMLEKDIEERRPAYREYIRKTSAFFPLPPKD